VKILHALLEATRPNGAAVNAVHVGAFQTAVSAAFTGLASTCRPEHSCVPEAEQGVADAGSLVGRDARELATLVLSLNPLEASIGMAAINALLAVDQAQHDDKEASVFLSERAAGKDLAIIGHFPFVERLRPIVRKLYVIERNPLPGDLSVEEGWKVLPRCDVVCVTGATLINHTFDDVMRACKGAYVALVGPSAPLSPVVFEFGVRAVCGARVTDPAAVLERLTQGATFRQIRKAGVRLATALAPDAGEARA
jgi:hypothetical protein